MNAYTRDLIERVCWTFVQGALATVSLEALATGDPSALHAAYVGGAAAVLSLIKGIAAKRLGDPESASTVR